MIVLPILLIAVTLFCAILFDCISDIISPLFFGVFTVIFLKGTWSTVDNNAAILGLQFMAQVTLFPVRRSFVLLR